MEAIVTRLINALTIKKIKEVATSLEIETTGVRNAGPLRQLLFNYIQNRPEGGQQLTFSYIIRKITPLGLSKAEAAIYAESEGVEIDARDNTRQILERIRETRENDNTPILNAMEIELSDGPISISFTGSRYITFEGFYKFSLIENGINVEDRPVLNLSSRNFVNVDIPAVYNNNDICLRNEMHDIIRSLIEKIINMRQRRVTFSLRQMILIRLKENNPENALEYGTFNIVTERAAI